MTTAMSPTSAVGASPLRRPTTTFLIALLVALIGLLAGSMLPLSPALAVNGGTDPQDTEPGCLIITLIELGEDADGEVIEAEFVSSVRQGGEYVLSFGFGGGADNVETCGLEEIAPFATVVDIDVPLPGETIMLYVVIRDPDGFPLLADEEDLDSVLPYFFADLGDDGVFEPFTLERFDYGDRTRIEPNFGVPFPADGRLGDGRISSGFAVRVASDAPVGSYELLLAVLSEPDPESFGYRPTAAHAVPFTVVAGDPEPGPVGPAATVTCDAADPLVGATVTCALTSDPGVEFLWTASTDPVFATGVVTTDVQGSGTFAFVVPASAVGSEVLVEIVEWTAPLSIGTVSGPVPTVVPAGEGPVPALTLLLVASALVMLFAPFAPSALFARREDRVVLR
jgi:hypothetical protein